MRPLFFFFGLSIFLINQNNKLTITQKFCKSESICLIKSDVQIGEHKGPIHFKNGKFHVNRLPKGECKLKFINLFGQEVEQTISLDKKRTKIEICIDELIPTNYKTVIKQLYNGEQLRIEYYESGCEHNFSDSIILEKYDDKIITQLKKTQSTTELNSEIVKSVMQFERELMEIQNSHFDCTTQGLYIIKRNNEIIIKVEDNSCEWNGFYKLKELLSNQGFSS